MASLAGKKPFWLWAFPEPAPFPKHPRWARGRPRYLPIDYGYRAANDVQSPSWFKHRAIDAFILLSCIGFPVYRRQRMRVKPIYKFMDENKNEVVYYNDLKEYKKAVWGRRRFENRHGGVYRAHEFDFTDRTYADHLSLEPFWLRTRNWLTINSERPRVLKWLNYRLGTAQNSDTAHTLEDPMGWNDEGGGAADKWKRPRQLLHRLFFRVPWRGDRSQLHRMQAGKGETSDSWLERGNFPWYGYVDQIRRNPTWKRKKLLWNRRRWRKKGWINHGQKGLEYLGQETLDKLSAVGMATGTGVGAGTPDPKPYPKGQLIYMYHGPYAMWKKELLGSDLPIPEHIGERHPDRYRF